MKWIRDVYGLLRPASTETDALELEDTFVPNRAMRRAARNAAKRKGPGYTRAMRKGREQRGRRAA